MWTTLEVKLHFMQRFLRHRRKEIHLSRRE